MGFFDIVKNIFGGLNDDKGWEMDDVIKLLAAYDARQGRDPKVVNQPQSPEQKEYYKRWYGYLDDPAVKDNMTIASGMARDAMQRIGPGLAWKSPKTFSGEVGYGGTSPFSGNIDAIMRDIAKLGVTPTAPSTDTPTRPDRPRGGGVPNPGANNTGFDIGGGRGEAANVKDGVAGAPGDVTTAGVGGDLPWNGVNFDNPKQSGGNVGEIRDGVQAAIDWLREHPEVMAAGRGAIKGALAGAGFGGMIIGATLEWLNFRNKQGGQPTPGGSGAIPGGMGGPEQFWQPNIPAGGRY